MQVTSISHQYASGSKRFAAFLIDWFLLSTVLSITFFRWIPDGHYPLYEFHRHIFNFGFSLWRLHFLKEILLIIYFSYMESSKYQASFGKIVMGIKVVDKNNQPLQFRQALLRNLSKILSGFLLGLGYIMIIFDQRKQGLHDKIADTFIVHV